MNAFTHRRYRVLRNALFGAALLGILESASAAITITENVTPTLGTLFAGASGRNFILNTDETVSGADAADYFGGAVTGQLSIVGESKNVNIVAENITTSGGVSVNSIPCRYHNGSQTTCDGSGINDQVKKNHARTLWVGVDINTSQTHSGGDTASVSFDIAVNII